MPRYPSALCHLSGIPHIRLTFAPLRPRNNHNSVSPPDSHIWREIKVASRCSAVMSAICVCTHRQMRGRDDRLCLYLTHLSAVTTLLLSRGPPAMTSDAQTLPCCLPCVCACTFSSHWHRGGLAMTAGHDGACSTPRDGEGTGTLPDQPRLEFTSVVRVRKKNPNSTTVWKVKGERLHRYHCRHSRDRLSDSFNQLPLLPLRTGNQTLIS